MWYPYFVVAKFGFFVSIWEEQSSRFIKESSVKRTGQLALRLVDSDSAQVCALPAFPPSSLDFALGQESERSCSSLSLHPFLFYTVSCSLLVSLLREPFVPETVLCISLFSSPLSLLPLLSFALSVSCFLSGPRLV